MDDELLLRISVIAPPSGVTFRVRGAHDMLSPAQSTDNMIVFDVPIRVRQGTVVGAFSLLGTYTYGPKIARFVYVTSGTLAGQAESGWTRAAKVPLRGITPALVAATHGAPALVLAARIAGTARDGGPACATVALLDGGWQVQRHTEYG